MLFIWPSAILIVAAGAIVLFMASAGRKKNRAHGGTPPLTDEESEFVEDFLKSSRRIIRKDALIPKNDKSYYEKFMVAFALYQYALRCSIEGKEKGDEAAGNGKALASVTKAYGMSPLPIYRYYEAHYLQRLGRKDEARDGYRAYLKEDDAHVPDEIEKTLFKDKLAFKMERKSAEQELRYFL